MFRTANLKLYRKFIILAILLTCLYTIPASNKVEASACCDTCESFYDSCTFYCLNNVKEDNIPSCLTTCEGDYQACAQLCAPGPGQPMGCNHP
jgi:hypothetical protein